MGLMCDLCLFYTLGGWDAEAGSTSPGSSWELTQDWLGAVLWVPAHQGPADGLNVECEYKKGVKNNA